MIIYFSGLYSFSIIMDYGNVINIIHYSLYVYKFQTRPRIIFTTIHYFHDNFNLIFETGAN